MLSTEEQRKICAQYSKLIDGKVQCPNCPLVISVVNLMCHANSHYDPDLCDFVLDEYEESEENNL